MIAKGISPLRPENAGVEAGRILFRQIEDPKWQADSQSAGPTRFAEIRLWWE
jgi:hypothetical protein